MSHAPSKQQHKVQTTTKNWKEESISTYLAAINLNKPIDKLLDKKINLKQNPASTIEEFVSGQVFKLVNIGANKMITNEVILDNHEASFICLKEYYALVSTNNAACALPHFLNLNKLLYFCRIFRVFSRILPILD